MGRKIAAGLATAGLSITGAFVLMYGALHAWWLAALLALIVSMGLVVVATVVGTLWSGEAVGLLLGAPPLSVIWWIAIIEEGDAQGGIAGVFITLLALAVSAASWGLAFAMIRRSRKGGTGRGHRDRLLVATCTCSAAPTGARGERASLTSGRCWRAGRDVSRVVRARCRAWLPSDPRFAPTMKLCKTLDLSPASTSGGLAIIVWRVR